MTRWISAFVAYNPLVLLCSSCHYIVASSGQLSQLPGIDTLKQNKKSFTNPNMGQKLVNDLFKTLADGHLLWNTIIRPEHKRRKQHEPPEPGQKYNDKQTKALEYFACKPREKKKNKGKGREQPSAGSSRQAAPKPTLFANAASSSSTASKSTRRR